MMLAATVPLAGCMSLGDTASEANDHVCPTEPPSVGPPAIGTPGGSRPAPAPSPEARPPVQVAGCLPEAVPLKRVSISGAERATALAAEPGSRAGVFRFRSEAERDWPIQRWIADAAGDDLPVPKTMTFYLNQSNQSSYRLRSGDQVQVMYPEGASSGRLCLVHARVTLVPYALPGLNNWCLDRLALWGN